MILGPLSGHQGFRGTKICLPFMASDRVDRKESKIWVYKVWLILINIDQQNNMSEINKIIFRIHPIKQQKSKSADRSFNQTQFSHKIPPKKPQLEGNSPIKKFQEYFGKVKPAFFRQLRNIFDKSQFQQYLSTTTNEILHENNIKTLTLTSRNRFFNRNKYNLNETNNFTIEPYAQTNVYRKAKLNKLISYKQTIDQNVDEDIVRDKLRESQEIIRELKNKGDQTERSYSTNNKILKMVKIIDKGKKQGFFQLVNPNNKQKFTTQDLNHMLSFIHHANFYLSSHFYYFNVYIEEGNNSDLLKNIVRMRTGWRIVEIPDNANLIWTQFYRKSILHKRLHKIQIFQLQDSKSKEKNEKIGYSFRSKISSISKKTNYQRLQPQNKVMQNQSYNIEVKRLFTKKEIEEINNDRSNLLKIKKNIQITHNVLIHNHFPENSCISDKKNLLFHLKNYMEARGDNVFEVVPESYELLSQNLQEVLMNRIQAYNYWLIKPGQNSNRGRGIIITHSKNETLQWITKKFNEQQNDKQKIKVKAKPKSLILQKYIIPFLYNNRKIDIRSYMLVTVINKQLRMYFYEQCYIRTSCKYFDINSTNKYVHLTNDAIQSSSNQYGKYQEGNKLSEAVFSKYIDEEYNRSRSGEESIWQKIKEEMKQRCIKVIQASFPALTKHIYDDRKQNYMNEEEKYYFQLFGMDFMIDQDYKLWLIEVNTNPAITHDCSKILNNLIPKMLQNTLFLAVQPLMKPIRFHQHHISNQYVVLLNKNIK